jgi:hypothetical protein
MRRQEKCGLLKPWFVAHETGFRKLGSTTVTKKAQSAQRFFDERPLSAQRVLLRKLKDSEIGITRNEKNTTQA